LDCSSHDSSLRCEPVATRAAEFEIGIHRRDSQTYAVEIRLLPPGADEEVRPESGSMQLDLEAMSDEEAERLLADEPKPSGA
jgi:hypothetical protein